MQEIREFPGLAGLVADRARARAAVPVDDGVERVIRLTGRDGGINPARRTEAPGRVSEGRAAQLLANSAIVCSESGC